MLLLVQSCLRPLSSAPGMMHTIEGRLRTIPGIAGAIIPPGPSSTSTDTHLSPRLEDKDPSTMTFARPVAVTDASSAATDVLAASTSSA